MKSKVHDQVQSRPMLALRSEPVPFVQAEGRAQDEIRKFFQALDSYSARAAREPGVTFHQHLRSIFTTGDGIQRRPARARHE
jgi:hypothetical protein